MSFLVKTTNYDLKKTLESGQVFRFLEMSDGGFRVMSTDRICYVKQTENGIYIKTGDDEHLGRDDKYWRNYFNFSKSYNTLEQKIKGNAFLEEVFEYNRGLRLLKQDPWEGLVTFIISQQKKIRQIQICVERLCSAAGKYLGPNVYAFPTPERILNSPISYAKLGYRQSYVLNAAEEIDSGNLDLSSLCAGNCSYHNCLQALCRLHGVGSKVANCVALFCLDHYEAFPVDVHIQRILEIPEMSGFSASTYGEDAGLLQQYLFNYAITHGY